MNGLQDLLAIEVGPWDIRHLALAFLFIVLGFVALIVVVAMVWTAELLNTAIETLCDVVSPDHDTAIARVKDVSAGAVLCSALGALAVGCVIFGPRLIALI